MDVFPSRNAILAKLPSGVREALAPYLSRRDLKHGEDLFGSDVPARQAWFPESGLVAIMVDLSDGFSLETGLVGHEGVAGAASDIASPELLGRCVVQVAGVAVHAPAAVLREAAAGHLELNRRLNLFEQFVAAEARQSALCIARHDIEPRLARWLLRCQDRIGDRLPLTQEGLSAMLGTRRSSVSQAASALERVGAVEYARGHIHILDRGVLEARSCECYAELARHALNLRHDLWSSSEYLPGLRNPVST